MKSSFAIFVLLLASCFLHLYTEAQSGTWVWVSGSSETNPGAGYGTQGVPSVNNTPMGLYQPAYWEDKNGNFWIFGGVDDNSDERDDLWEYNPGANTWTWIKGTTSEFQAGIYGTKGVPGINNLPGARGWGTDCWTDSSGDLWLYGGAGYDVNGEKGDLNDLWRYNIASNEWTWISGSSTRNTGGNYGTLHVASPDNLPVPRSESNAAWLDANNNFWFFGGIDIAGNAWNDIWRYNIDSNEWTWNGGSGQTTAVYGVLGVESPENIPNGRWCYTHWLNGNYLYFAGGANWSMYYNDVWRFNMTTFDWTWVGGDTLFNETGDYVDYCTINQGNMPRGTKESRATQVNTGCTTALYMFGGFGSGSDNGTEDPVNDLWSFDPASNNWRWVCGSGGLEPTGNFGTKGVAAQSNIPPGLAGIAFWSDNQGNLWIWGGCNTGLIRYNTLWKYIPDSTCIPTDSGTGNLTYTLSATGICNGDTALLTISGDTGISVTPQNYVHWIDSDDASLTPDTTTLFTIIGYSPCGAFNTQSFTLAVLTDTVHISSNKLIMCPGDTAQICAPAGLTNYNWNTGDTTACISATSAGNYYVSVTANGNCQATSNHISISTYPPTTVETNVTGDTLRGFDAVTYQWLLNDVAITGATASIYIAETSGSYTLQITDSFGCIETSNPIAITGLNNIPSANSITVFPNPTSSGWQLNVSGEWIGSIAEIFDATGRVVFKSIINNQHSMIEIAGLANGVYELRITQQGYNVVRKLVKI